MQKTKSLHYYNLFINLVNGFYVVSIIFHFSLILITFNNLVICVTLHMVIQHPCVPICRISKEFMGDLHQEAIESACILTNHILLCCKANSTAIGVIFNNLVTINMVPSTNCNSTIFQHHCPPSPTRRFQCCNDVLCNVKEK